MDCWIERTRRELIAAGFWRSAPNLWQRYNRNDMNNKIAHIDRAIHPPTLENGVTAAWQYDLEKLNSKLSQEERDKNCTVAAWVICAPWAHAFWSYYVLAAVHLRPLAGTPPVRRYLVGATHEILLAAISPEHAPDMEKPAAHWLTPMNYAGQWIEQNANPVRADQDAAARIRKCVDDILEQKLSPDTDFRSQWVARFGDCMILH